MILWIGELFIHKVSVPQILAILVHHTVHWVGVTNQQSWTLPPEIAQLYCGLCLISPLLVLIQKVTTLIRHLHLSFFALINSNCNLNWENMATYNTPPLCFLKPTLCLVRHLATRLQSVFTLANCIASCFVFNLYLSMLLDYFLQKRMKSLQKLSLNKIKGAMVT